MVRNTTSKTKTCRYHCVKCHKHFTSLIAYDAHIGPVGVHHDPAESKHLQVQTYEGECRLGPHTDEMVPLWEHSYDKTDNLPAWDHVDSEPEALPF